jgi:hypothetical protein
MHSCQSDLSREAIDGCALGIGATVEPVGAIAVAIFVVICDAVHCFALAYYVVSELTTEISNSQYLRLSRSAVGR